MFNRIRTIRKRWLVLFTAVALLAVGLTAGAAFAAGAPGPGLGFGPGHDARAGHGHRDLETRLLARVAEIIEVDPATLQNAFTTAFNEIADAEFAAKMDAHVADDTLTSEQAATANTWFRGRPADTGELAFIVASTGNADKVSRMLERGVAKGYLTQAQADAITDWHDQRPDFLPERSHKHGRHHRDGDDDDDDSGS